jgi:hypothetical protein
MLFFPLLNIKIGNVFLEQNFEYLLPFLLGGCKCKQGVGPGCGQKHFLDQVFNPFIWGIIIGFGHSFFFIGRYLS